MRYFILSLCLLLSSAYLQGQGSIDYKGGLKVKLSEDGSKYFRLITWHQMWATTQNMATDPGGMQLSTDFRLRRSRFLMFAQINKRFLVLTHFGLNNLSTASMDPVGKGAGAQIFMHDAWADFTVIPKVLHVGGGLHYWNGVTRLANQSTLNMLTLDAPGHNWGMIGLSDQFARHLGFFAKGKLGKLDYRLAVNQGLRNNFFAEVDYESLPVNQAVYNNPNQEGGGKIYSAYLNYQFLDQEGNTLPYMVGSYLGTKRVLNVGAGFFHHEAGASHKTDAGTTEIDDVNSFGADVFFDSPIGENGQAVTAYASVVKNDWGPNMTGAPVRPALVGGTGSGTISYAQVGYLTPKFSEKVRVQPYLHYTRRNLDAYEDFDYAHSSQFGAGLNLYLDGHNAKVTFEYQRNQDQSETIAPTPKNLLRMQMMLYL